MNWVNMQVGAFWKKDAEKSLEKIKKEEKDKRFKMIKVSDRPKTYKQVEICDSED